MSEQDDLDALVADELTDEYYTSRNGRVCPYCKTASGVHTTDAPVFDGAVWLLPHECDSCRKEWWEVAAITGWKPR